MFSRTYIPYKSTTAHPSIHSPMRRLFYHIFKISILQTLWFNFKYLPFMTAIRLPVYIYHRTILGQTKGKIVIDAEHIRHGMIKIGLAFLKNTDAVYNRTIWQQEGTIVFHGPCNLGRGVKITVEKDGVLKLGSRTTLTGNSTILCRKAITVGNDCMISWDVLLMDNDAHTILNDQKVKINPDKPIHIGNHVWIGCRSILLKGVEIGDDTVIAACSTLSRSFHEEHEIIGGLNKVLHQNVTWEL